MLVSATAFNVLIERVWPAGIYNIRQIWYVVAFGDGWHVMKLNVVVIDGLIASQATAARLLQFHFDALTDER